ncbi:hypothetical protein [Staphylococcus caprae]|uniref:hypothetical protein n=1 Tax=Staphylococcus caprae TaxID=29380 RepID=UPI003B20FBC1
MVKWLSGDSNIYQMQMTKDALVVEIVNLKESDESLDKYYIDKVRIPLEFLNASHYHVVLEQLQTNDLKHVGYRYEENAYKLTEPFKTMYHTQVKGTMNIFIKNRIEMMQS